MPTVLYRVTKRGAFFLYIVFVEKRIKKYKTVEGLINFKPFSCCSYNIHVLKLLFFLCRKTPLNVSKMRFLIMFPTSKIKLKCLELNYMYRNIHIEIRKYVN